jgi:hypothetical protein
MFVGMFEEQPQRVRWSFVNIQKAADRLHKRASHPGCDSEVFDGKDRIVTSFAKRVMCGHDNESQS